MTTRVWDRFLTERDQLVLAASGYGKLAGFGERPALVVVDVSYNFAGTQPEPILQSIKRWRNSCGQDAWDAIPVIQRLIAACRGRCPIVYTTNTRRPDGFEAGSWRWKNSRELEDTEQEIDGNKIVAEIEPQPEDLVIYKTKPSGFFGTPLLSFLIDLNVDSLIVTGVSTSGCVRATVIDAFSNNLRCCVVEDACFDRTEVAHAINLFDMNAKYADVRPSSDVLPYLKALPPMKRRD
jgi:nicotinamidase-related amidase